MKYKRMLTRLTATLAALVLLCSLLPAVSAATVAKASKVYDIAVAYDNSGSMYSEAGQNNRSWCYAKYAMEIFASMLDYGAGDKLTIFPMWPGKTQGVSFSGSRPVEIRGKGDIDKISDMYTPSPSGTPFATVETAHDYLVKKSKADEKWLIVLTDGAFNGFTDPDDTRARLKQLATPNLKVQYLGFMGAPSLSADESDGFYAATAGTGEQLKVELLNICNQIFRRDELPTDRLSGNTLTLDLSMRKLIVFVQGKDAKVSGLTGADGKAVAVSMDSGQRKYSKVSAGGKYANSPWDDTLYGQVVTFGACPKGTYTLDYSGADKIQIFYEPDVDMVVTLTNSDGEAVDPANGELYAGDYTFTAKVVDKVTGEDVTNAPLMGGHVPIDVQLTYGSGKTAKAENGGVLTLEEDEDIRVDITGTYLDKYTISNKDDPDIFPPTLRVVPKPVPLTLTATAEQSGAWYTLLEHESWKPIRVDVLLDGQPLTDAQLQALDMEITADGDSPVSLRTAPIPGQSAVYVYVGQAADGSYVEPATGDYTLRATAATTDAYGRTLEGVTTLGFGVKLIPLWLWLIILAIVIAAVIFLLGFPAKPARIYLHDTAPRGSVHGPLRTAGLSVPRMKSRTKDAFSGSSRMRFAWGKNSWIKNLLKSKTMDFCITVSDVQVNNLNIGGSSCVRNADGKYINANTGGPVFKIRNGTTVTWTEKYGTDNKLYTLNGKITINKM